MFDQRLRVMLTLFGIALTIVVLRLGHLQLVRASYYRKQAQRSLLQRPSSMPFVRGSILDRTGEVLVRDEACWDIAIDYHALAAALGEKDEEKKNSYLKRQVAKLKRQGRYAGAVSDEEVGHAFLAEMDDLWRDLSYFTASDNLLRAEALHARGQRIYKKVSRVRTAVTKRRGFDAPVAEENEAHAIVTGLTPSQQIDARERFGRYPWVHILPASQRSYASGSEPFAHLLGRLGPVTAEVVENDPNADDPFARYRANERRGLSGVEWAAEGQLRGRRGQITRDRDGVILEENSFIAENGQDVTLTIHAGLQRRLYDLLGETVEGVPESSGGGIVVLHVPTREVLALISFPSYDPSQFDEQYALLREDTEHLPLWFRTVASRYAPGSTIKPLVCLAGLMNGTISLDTTHHCSGYLFDDVRDAWRCWRIHGTSQRMAHGAVDVVGALKGSCNVFMFHLGESLGVDGLCSVFDMVGIGKITGLGLREETRGINPTPGWLMHYKNHPVTPGTARNFAIGQGELSMTPVQVANLMAAYAAGTYRQLTLIKTQQEKPEWEIPATAAQWQAIRRGIYGVVNDPTGTAYKYARWDHSRWALCGKTGSASAYAWPTAYRVPYVDETGAEQMALIRAGAKKPAVTRFVREFPQATFDPSKIEIAARWPIGSPPEGERFSHAWFGAFLQPLDQTGQPDWSQTAPIAFAVMVEFGGSGGRTSGPLARRVAETLVELFGPDLNVSGGTLIPNGPTG